MFKLYKKLGDAGKLVVTADNSKTKLVLQTSQFLNYCRSRINRIKQQKLTLLKSPTLDSYNERQLIQLT